jgi:hypothetical protein
MIFTALVFVAGISGAMQTAGPTGPDEISGRAPKDPICSTESLALATDIFRNVRDYGIPILESLDKGLKGAASFY